MRLTWGVRPGPAYLAGAAQAAATLLESEGLLALIVVSLVLTAWTGGWGTRDRVGGCRGRLTRPGIHSHPDEDSHLQGSGPASHPQESGPTAMPVRHEKGRTSPSWWVQELSCIKRFLCTLTQGRPL